jgi:hypothetical protein
MAGRGFKRLASRDSAVAVALLLLLAAADAQVAGCVWSGGFARPRSVRITRSPSPIAQPRSTTIRQSRSLTRRRESC